MNDQERADAILLAQEVESAPSSNLTPKRARAVARALAVAVLDIHQALVSAQSEVAQLKAELQRLTEAAQDVVSVWTGLARAPGDTDLYSALDDLAAALSEAPATEGSPSAEIDWKDAWGQNAWGYWCTDCAGKEPGSTLTMHVGLRRADLPADAVCNQCGVPAHPAEAPATEGSQPE